MPGADGEVNNVELCDMDKSIDSIHQCDVAETEAETPLLDEKPKEAFIDKLERMTPHTVDYASDHVRVRFMAVPVWVLIFYLLASIATYNDDDDANYSSRVSYTTQPPSHLVAGPNAFSSRYPHARLIDQNNGGIEGETLYLNVTDVVASDHSHSINCDTKNIHQNKYTLWYYQVKAVCTPIMKNTAAVTNSLGVASWPDLLVEAGPLGKYTLGVSHNDSDTTFQSNAATFYTEPAVDVMYVNRNTTAPNFCDANVPLDPIRIQLVDQKHNGNVSGKVVVAFSWREPAFYEAFEQVPDRQSLVDELLAKTTELSPQYQLVRDGQNVAILENVVSTGADADGHVTFKDLKVVTATSAKIFISFMVDNTATSWHDATSGPNAEPNNVFPQPLFTSPGVKIPIILRSKVGYLEIMGNVTRGSGRRMFYGGSTPPPPISVSEEESFSMSILVKDRNGKPLKGVRCLALLSMANGMAFPNDYIMNLAVNGPRYASVVKKQLKGVFTHEPTGDDGLCVFPQLGFDTVGAAGKFGIRFAAEGVRAENIQYVNVASLVKRVLITVQPGTINLVTMNAPSLQSEAKADQVGEIDANLLVTDENGKPIAGKNATMSIVGANDLQPVAKDVVNVFMVANVEGYNAYLHASTVRGDLRVALRFTFVDQAAVRALGGVRAIFYVDGVAANATSILVFNANEASQYTGTCTSVIVEQAPPDVMTPPFHKFMTKVKAVDALGFPIPGLPLFPRLVPLYNRVPELFKLGWVQDCNADAEHYVAGKVNENSATVSNGCKIMATNDNMLWDYMVASMKNLTSAQVYQDALKTVTSIKAVTYKYVTDSAGEVTLPAYLVDGPTGTMAIEFRGLDYGCRSNVFFTQVKSSVNRIRFNTSFDDLEERVVDPTDPFLGTNAFWPWDKVDQTVTFGNATVKGSIVPGGSRPTLSGQYVDYDAVRVPNNFWITLPWWYFAFDVFFLNSACATPDDFTPGVCQRTRFSTAHLGSWAAMGRGGDFFSDSNGVVTIVGGLNDIASVGAWDVYLQSSGQVVEIEQMLTIRFDNPVESITWVRQPPQHRLLEIWPTGKPFAASYNLAEQARSPYVRLNLKSQYTGISALQCPNDDSSTTQPELSSMIWGTAGCPTADPACGCKYSPFFIQKAPVHAYFTVTGANVSTEAAFVDAYNDKHYGVQLNAFPHGDNQKYYNDFTYLYVAQNTRAANVQMNVALSFASDTRLSEPKYGEVVSPPSQTIGMTFGSTETASLNIATQPSSTCALGSLFATPPAVQIQVPTSSENVQWTNLDFIIAVLPTEYSGTNVPAKARWSFGAGLLRNYYCMYQNGQLAKGKCTPSNLAWAIQGSYKQLTVTFDSLVIGEGRSGDTLKLAFYEQLNLGNRFPNSTEQLPVFPSEMNQITVTDSPTSLAITSQPPSVLSVGEVFEFACAVTAEGAELQDLFITANITKYSSNGVPSFSGAQYINDAFSSPSQKTADDVTLPVLEPYSVTARSDRYGVARFLLTFEKAPPNGEYALFCTVGSVQSKKSSEFTLTNPVTAVVAQDSKAKIQRDLETNVEEPSLTFKDYSFPSTFELGPFKVTAFVNESLMQYTDSLYLGHFIPSTIDFALIPDHVSQAAVIHDLASTAGTAAVNGSSQYLNADLAVYQHDVQVQLNTKTQLQNNYNALETTCNSEESQLASAQTELNTCISNPSSCTDRSTLETEVATRTAKVANCPVQLEQANVAVEQQTLNVATATSKYLDAQGKYAEQALQEGAGTNTKGKAEKILKGLVSSHTKLAAASQPVTSATILNFTNATNIKVTRQTNRRGIGYTQVDFNVEKLYLHAKVEGDFFLSLRVQGISSNLFKVNILQDYHENLFPSARKLQEGPSSKKMGQFEKGFLLIGMNLIILFMMVLIVAGSLTATTHNAWWSIVSVTILGGYFGLIWYDASQDGWDFDYYMQEAWIAVCFVTYLYMWFNMWRDRNLEWMDPKAHDWFSVTHVEYYKYVTKLMDEMNYDKYEPDPEDIALYQAALENIADAAMETNPPLTPRKVFPEYHMEDDDIPDCDVGHKGRSLSTTSNHGKGAANGSGQGNGDGRGGLSDDHQTVIDNVTLEDKYSEKCDDLKAQEENRQHARELLVETARLKARQKKKDDEFQAMTQPLSQFKLIVKYGFTGQNPDCFYLPGRVLAMVVVTFAMLYVMSIKFYDQNVDLYNYIVEKVRDYSLLATFDALPGLENAFAQASGAFDLHLADELYVYNQAIDTNNELLGLANAAYNSWYVGIGVATFFFLWAIPVHLGCIRMQVLLLRRGEWHEWYPIPVKEKVTVIYIIYYLSALVVNYAVVVYLLATLIWLITTIFWWETSRDYVLDKVAALLVSIIFTLMNVIALVVAMTVLATPQRILYRKSFVLFDMYEGVITIVGSLVDSLLRVIEGLIFFFIGMFRMEHSIQPNWTNHYIIQLDKPPKATAAAIMMIHTHQNPIMNVFCDLLRRDIAERNEVYPDMDDTDRIEGVHCRRAQRRWTLAKLLILNPSLINLRKHNLPPVVPPPPPDPVKEEEKKKKKWWQCWKSSKDESQDMPEEAIAKALHIEPKPEEDPDSRAAKSKHDKLLVV